MIEENLRVYEIRVITLVSGRFLYSKFCSRHLPRTRKTWVVGQPQGLRFRPRALWPCRLSLPAAPSPAWRDQNWCSRVSGGSRGCDQSGACLSRTAIPIGGSSSTGKALGSGHLATFASGHTGPGYAIAVMGFIRLLRNSYLLLGIYILYLLHSIAYF